jgi:hypothetical protein
MNSGRRILMPLPKTNICKGMNSMRKRTGKRTLAKSIFLFGALSAWLLCATLGTAQARKPSGLLQIDLKQPYVPATTESHPCREADWKFLDLASTRSLLADYNYEIRAPFTCRAASVPWLSSARILRIHESLGLDNYRTFTVIQGSATSRVWVIPIEFGMILYPHVEGNPHNIAAFNDLLCAASRKPDESMLLELGNLYQFVLGAEQRFDSDHMPKTVEDRLKVNDIEGMIEHDSHGLTYKHREFDGDQWTYGYMIWEFNFESSAQGLRLRSVERGPLDPATDDIKQP